MVEKCYDCGGEMQEKPTHQDVELDMEGYKKFTINIPCRKCLSCGKTVMGEDEAEECCNTFDKVSEENRIIDA